VPKQRLELIRASEIGEYLYCSRAWWLRRVGGLIPEGAAQRELGVRRHQQHGRAVALSGALMVVGIVLVLIAGFVLLVR
jgi:CRISPR/Cas system-associated exonuclease Cas4 (RecB family)